MKDLYQNLNSKQFPPKNPPTGGAKAPKKPKPPLPPKNPFTIALKIGAHK